MCQVYKELITIQTEENLPSLACFLSVFSTDNRSPPPAFSLHKKANFYSLFPATKIYKEYWYIFYEGQLPVLSNARHRGLGHVQKLTTWSLDLHLQQLTIVFITHLQFMLNWNERAKSLLTIWLLLATNQRSYHTESFGLRVLYRQRYGERKKKIFVLNFFIMFLFPGTSTKISFQTPG